MAGLKKPGPRNKVKKARKAKVGSLSAQFIPRGRAAKMRRTVLPI
jgi:hypothetical protein